MIRTFDRYFLLIAIANMTMAAVGVAALYILIDYLYNVESFANFGFEEVARHYLHNVPPVLYLLGPMIALMGASFGISRLLKNRELLPLACGGLRSFRSLRMFWVGALGAALVLVAVRVWALPALEFAAQGSGVANLRKSSGEAVSLRDDEGNYWHIGAFNLLDNEISDVTVIRYAASEEPMEHIRASALKYEKGAWRGKQRVIELSGFTHREVIFDREGPIEGSSLGPNAIATRGVKRTYRAPAELRAMMAEFPHRNDLRVSYYQIFSWPLLTLALVLAGAVIALRMNVRNVFLAAALTIILAFGVFALVLVFEKLAKNGSLSPEAGVLALPVILIVLSLGGLRWGAD